MSYSDFHQHVTHWDIMRTSGFRRLSPTLLDDIEVRVHSGDVVWWDRSEEWDPDDYRTYNRGWRSVGYGSISVVQMQLIKDIIKLWGINDKIDQHNRRTSYYRELQSTRHKMNREQWGRYNQKAPMLALRPVDPTPISEVYS